MKNLQGISSAAIATGVALLLAACHGTAPTYSVSGSVTGSTGAFVVKLNGANDVSMSGDGSFKFTGKLLQGDTFNVQIVDATDRCAVSGGAGTVAMSDITDVAITCQAQSLQTLIRTAKLNGAQENPPVTTNALGAGGLVVVPSSTQMALTGGITFSGLTTGAGQVNIHLAPAGNPTGNGGAIVPLILAADGLTAIVPPGTTLDIALLGPLLRGEFYFNVATSANPNGEIRGPIQLQGGVAASAAFLDKTQVAPPTTSTALGTGVLLADLATGKLLISYITHSVTGATLAGIHTSTGPTSNGLTIVPFANLQSNISSGTNMATPLSTARLTAQNLADFASSLLYFQVNSQTNPNGDIRGNISPL